MPLVHLTRVESNNQNLRTNTVYGEAVHLPVVGRPFVMFAEALESPVGVRIVSTSAVKEVATADDGSITFKTENSTYKVEPAKE